MLLFYLGLQERLLSDDHVLQIITSCSDNFSGHQRVSRVFQFPGFQSVSAV